MRLALNFRLSALFQLTGSIQSDSLGDTLYHVLWILCHHHIPFHAQLVSNALFDIQISSRFISCLYNYYLTDDIRLQRGKEG